MDLLQEKQSLLTTIPVLAKVILLRQNRARMTTHTFCHLIKLVQRLFSSPQSEVHHAIDGAPNFEVEAVNAAASHDAGLLIVVHHLHQIIRNFEVERWLEQIHGWKMKLENETNPYAAPQSDPGVALPVRPKATGLAKVGAWLQLLPLLGIIGTVLGMMRAFAILKTSGAGDPAKLSAAIGEVLISTAMGFFGGMFGCVLLGLAVFAQGRQPRWVKIVFWVSVLPALYAVFMVVMASVGGRPGGG